MNQTLEQQLLAHAETSNWLRKAIKATALRDICHAMNDADALLAVLQERHDSILQARYEAQL